jgi:hypothetical protein
MLQNRSLCLPEAAAAQASLQLPLLMSDVLLLLV